MKARRFFSSLNLAATLALLFALFIMVNYISSRRYWRKDISRQQLTVLSQQTLQTLKTLQSPLTIIVFYQPTHRLYELVKDQLKEFERASAQVHVEFVDPQQDIARAEQLVKAFEIDALNLVIFQSGNKHKYLSDTDLADYDFESVDPMTGGRVKAFKGEAAFTAAIINVTQKTQLKLWHTTGHGEKTLDNTNPAGLSDFKKLLDQQNIAVETVNLLEKAEIPADVKLLLLAGPARRFTEAEVSIVEKYLSQGGRLLALIDPLDDTGLGDWLKRWGIVLGNNIVVDPARRLPFVSAANLFVTDYGDHPIVGKMKTLMTLFPLARSVTPLSPAPEGISASRLLMTSDAGWGETDTADERFQFNEGQDTRGPVSIAVAVEKAAPTQSRLVIVGDSEFLINAQLGNVGNKDFAMGAIYWLTEQEELIGISAKPVESIKLSLTNGQLNGIFWFSFLGLPLLFGGLGVAMWWSRRQ